MHAFLKWLCPGIKLFSVIVGALHPLCCKHNFSVNPTQSYNVANNETLLAILHFLIVSTLFATRQCLTAVWSEHCVVRNTQ